MDCNCTQLAYGETGYFSKIIVDYVEGSDQLNEFYEHPVDFDGMAAAIAARQKFPTDRDQLVSSLQARYKDVSTSSVVLTNIESLLSPETFTITTAHQPVIFTGTLYFVYKILHTVKLAAACKERFPGKHFVPVFYMGSEDADLEELGKIYMGTEKLVWDTSQKGAVGRMNPKGLEKIIDRLAGEISIHPHGPALISLFRDCYLSSPDIQTGTFKLINSLFQDYGVVIIVPDDAMLKRRMIPVFEDDLFNQTPSDIVGKTTASLGTHYKVQANPRAINLFYLKDDIGELIIREQERFEVRHTNLSFSAEELRQELRDHPERFSPNVILRGLFQEQILPNIAFIGGGGETAYWLELRDLFRHYNTPFPMLVLRNSFLLIRSKWCRKLQKLGISDTDIFQEEGTLLAALVRSGSDKQLSLDRESNRLQEEYEKLENIAAAVDPTLSGHVRALATSALKAVQNLEKKILKAEKRKFTDHQRQIAQVKSALFPLNGLQERVDNFISWYAQEGDQFFRTILHHSPALEQKFVILTEKLSAE